MAQLTPGFIGTSAYLQGQAEQAEQDALFAQQQAAQYQAEQQAALAQHQAQLDDMLQQQEMAYQQQIAAQQQARQESMLDGTPVNPAMQALYDELNKPEYARNGATVMSGQQATMWARQNVDKAIENVARANNMTDAQRLQLKARFEKDHGSLLKQKEAGFLADTGDLLNAVGEGLLFDLVGGVAQMGATVGGWNLEKNFGVNGAQKWLKENVVDNVDAMRAGWRSMLSDEAKDEARAFEQAKGAKETVAMLMEDPSYLLSGAAQMLGAVGVGGKATALAAKGAKAGFQKGGVWTLNNIIGVGGKKAASKGGEVAADISKAADAVTNVRAANWFSPTAAIMSEGSGAFNDVMTQDGAYNAETGQYSEDALIAAGTAGLLAGGITAAGMASGRTAEGILKNLGRRGDLASGSSAEAISRVGSMLGSTATKAETRAAIKAATDALQTHAGRELLERAANNEARKGLVGLVLGGGGTASRAARTAIGSMAAEGMEEALIGLVGSMAAEGIGEDGNWSLANVNGENVLNNVGKAGVMGAALGGAFSVAKVADQSRKDRELIADYNSQTEQLQQQQTQFDANIQAEIAPEVAALQRMGQANRQRGIDQAVAQDSINTTIAEQRAWDAANQQAQAELTAARVEAEIDALRRIPGRVVDANRRTAERADAYETTALEQMYAYDDALQNAGAVDPIAQAQNRIDAVAARNRALGGDSELVGYNTTFDASQVQAMIDNLSDAEVVLRSDDAVNLSAETIAVVQRAAELDRAEANLAMNPNPEVAEAIRREREVLSIVAEDANAELSVNSLPPVVQSLPMSQPVVQPVARQIDLFSLPEVESPTARVATKLAKNAFHKASTAKTFGVPAKSPIAMMLRSYDPTERAAIYEMVVALDSGVPVGDLLSDPAVAALVERVAHTDVYGGDVQTAFADLFSTADRVRKERGQPTAESEAVAADAKKWTRYGDDDGEAVKRVIEAKETRLDNATERTEVETNVAVLAATRDRYAEWIRRAYGNDMLDSVVFVAPSSTEHGKSNGFTVDGDPDRIYIVLHPGRTEAGVVWTVAHEQMHRGLTLRSRGRVLAKAGEWQDLLRPLAEHPFVRDLMGAMQRRYPNAARLNMVEEALAEIRAAQQTKNYTEFENRWGMALPAALRSSKTTSVIGKVVHFLKRIIAALGGTRGRVTDYDVNKFIRETNDYLHRAHSVPTTTAANTFAASISFDAYAERMDYYTRVARDTVPQFDSMDADQQRIVMSRLAANADDAQGMNELVVRNDNAERVPDGDDPLTAAKREAEQNAKKMAKGVADMSADKGTALRVGAERMLARVLIYPSRRGGDAYNAEAVARPVGIISPIGADGVVRLTLDDMNSGAREFRHFRLHEDGMTFSDVMLAAQEYVAKKYGNEAYSMQEASAVHAELLRGPNGEARPLTMEEQVILNRFDEDVLRFPTLRPILEYLRYHLPETWLPALDKVLDWFSVLHTRFVNHQAIGFGLNDVYNNVTGRTDNIMEQMRTDAARADAWLARNTDHFKAGKGFKTEWKEMSYRDGMDSVYDEIQQSGMSKERVVRDLYALNEAVLYQELLARDGVDKDGKRIIPDADYYDPEGAPMEHVTGFRYADFDTLDMTQGKPDLGAQRWLADFRQRPKAEQDAIGRVAAALAAVNRAVILQEQRHGVHPTDVANAYLRRGTYQVSKDGGYDLNLNEVFSDLHREGFDFGGFWLSMRDPDGNPYKTRSARGRTSVVNDPLQITQEVLKARVRKAFANKEMVNFVRMNLEMPNNHFDVEPATPRYDKELGETVWEYTDKGKKASLTVWVDGIPVALVAKTKAAKAMIAPDRASDTMRRIGMINHFFSAFKTTYSLSYLPVGLTRDIIGGYLNISGAIGERWLSAEDAPRVGMNAIKYALTSMPNTFKATVTGKGMSEWLSVYQEVGAGMFFGDELNSGAFRGETVSMLSRNPLMAKSKDALQAVGYTPETAMRLGSFRAYVEHFHPELARPDVSAAEIKRVIQSPANAAQYAAIVQATKHITSNFQQHGEDNVVRYLFPFFNATMQGTFDTLPRILSTQHGRRSVGMLLIASALAAAYGIADEEEDEFGNSKYFHSVNRGRAIVMGDTAIPVPDEIALFRSVIDNGVGIMSGKRNMVDAIVDVFESSTDMLTPMSLGQTGNTSTDIMYAAMPSLTHGFLGLATGKDIFGRPLLREAVYDENGQRVNNPADVERTTQRASEPGRELAEFLYGTTGGGIDMSGDEIDFFLQSYLGGVYNLMSKTMTASMRESSDVSGVGAVASVATKGFTNVKIDRDADRAWENLKAEVGVSLRHQGSTLDVLNAEQNEAVRQAAALIKRTENDMKKARSDGGMTIKQIYDLKELAEKDGRYADVRDLQADLQTAFAERDRIRAEAIKEAMLLGVIK